MQVLGLSGVCCDIVTHLVAGGHGVPDSQPSLAPRANQAAMCVFPRPRQFTGDPVPCSYHKRVSYLGRSSCERPIALQRVPASPCLLLRGWKI
jgi:hypothetical protein